MFTTSNHNHNKPTKRGMEVTDPHDESRGETEREKVTETDKQEEKRQKTRHYLFRPVNPSSLHADDNDKTKTLAALESEIKDSSPQVSTPHSIDITWPEPAQLAETHSETKQHSHPLKVLLRMPSRTTTTTNNNNNKNLAEKTHATRIITPDSHDETNENQLEEQEEDIQQELREDDQQQQEEKCSPPPPAFSSRVTRSKSANPANHKRPQILPRRPDGGGKILFYVPNGYVHDSSDEEDEDEKKTVHDAKWVGQTVNVDVGVQVDSGSSSAAIQFIYSVLKNLTALLCDYGALCSSSSTVQEAGGGSLSSAPCAVTRFVHNEIQNATALVCDLAATCSSPIVQEAKASIMSVAKTFAKHSQIPFQEPLLAPFPALTPATIETACAIRLLSRKDAVFGLQMETVASLPTHAAAQGNTGVVGSSTGKSNATSSASTRTTTGK